MRRDDPVEKTAYWLRRNLSEVPKESRSGLLDHLGDIQAEIIAQEMDRRGEPGEDEARKWARFWFIRTIGSRPKETFAGILFDGQWRRLDSKVLTIGSVAQVSIAPRAIAEWVFSFPTCVLFIAHNHPSGARIPSHGDRVLTERLKSQFGFFSVGVEHFLTTHDDCRVVG